MFVVLYQSGHARSSVSDTGERVRPRCGTMSALDGGLVTSDLLQQTLLPCVSMYDSSGTGST